MALAPINPTQLTPPRVAFIDERSGAISREWYRFFLSLLTATQTNQDEDELAFDGMVASLESNLNNLQNAFGVTPPDLGGTVTSVSFTGGIVSVATATTTPALTVAGTSGGIVYFSSATTWATSAALAASAIVLGGGAGAAPATTTTGTGVVTALGVNTGTAGAFVVNGGVLGTPSSGTVTNLTGTASININGTVGATTATTGAFTTITGSTSLTTPLHSGGTAAASTLILQSTSGAGTTDFIAFRTASQTERMRIDSSGNVGIGTAAPNASAILDVQSTTKGFRLPNMTTVEKNAVATPAAGLMVFDTTLAKACVYSGTAWETITSI